MLAGIQVPRTPSRWLASTQAPSSASSPPNPLRRARLAERTSLHPVPFAAAAVVSVVALGSGGEQKQKQKGCRQKPQKSATAVASAGRSSGGISKLDVATLRRDFPSLHEEVRPGVPLVYLDNAATSQKPEPVLKAMRDLYVHANSNVHRGMHTLAIRATDAFESARHKVARFVNAKEDGEIIFTRNATEALNLLVNTVGRATLSEGDEIILTVMEHHSNLVPWQILAQNTGAKLRFVGLSSDQQFNKEQFEELLSPKTKIVSFQHVSNVLGCVNPAQWIAERARAVGALVVVDACQSVPHMPVDVQALGVDFIVASGHKMCAPTGIGFLWGRGELLREAPPFLAGGEMIADVHLESSTYADIPHKFEAGTPAFAEAVALGAACDYLTSLAPDGQGMAALHAREMELASYLWEKMSTIPNIELYGPPPSSDMPDGRAALVTFNVEGCHPHDIATLIDQDKGVAIRAGHHCCQPLHRELGQTFSARASAHFYTTMEEIDTAVEAIKAAAEVLRGETAPEMDVAIADLLA